MVLHAGLLTDGPRFHSSRCNPAPAMVEQVIECVPAMAGVVCPLPAPGLDPLGASVVHTLTVGVDAERKGFAVGIQPAQMLMAELDRGAAPP